MRIYTRTFSRIVLVILISLCFASLSAARVAGNPMHSDEGPVTAIGLEDASITIGSQTYAVDRTGSVMDSLRSKAIQVSDHVVITYEIKGATKRLVTITKDADTIN